MSTHLSTHPAYPVSALTLSDVVADLALLIDGSDAAVDGITAAADIARGDTGGSEGSGHLVVTFTDADGHCRVAEVSMRARWVEDFCWHLRTTDGLAGPECTDCGSDLSESVDHAESRSLG